MELIFLIGDRLESQVGQGLVELYHNFPQFLQANIRGVLEIRTWKLPSTFFPARFLLSCNHSALNNLIYPTDRARNILNSIFIGAVSIKTTHSSR